LPEAGSPAIDVVPQSNGCGTITIYKTDQRGAPRPIGAKCDVGAVEAGWIHPVLWLPLVQR
jgi:hypothetical protein